MALLPPPQPFEHPTDLVIDLFGTFLGKRSERLVVRWRPLEASPSAVSLPLGQADGEVEPTGGMTAHCGADSEMVPSPLKNSAAESLPTINEGDADAADPSGSPPRLASKNQTADLLAAQLLGVWAHQCPPEVPLPTAAARLTSQLNQIADEPEQRPSGNWQERVVPMARLRSVTVTGRGVTISSDLIAALVERGISLSFLSGRGQPVAQLSAPGMGGTVQTRRSQLAAYDTSLGVEIAVEFIRGKLRNQKHQLQYSGKYLKSNDVPRFERLMGKINAISALRKQLLEFEGERLELVRDKLMGYEGTGARLYWEGVAILLEEKIDFPGRSTRGALDPVNSALNYGYGILYGQVSAAVVNAGLELYAGFLHVDRPGKPALVLDLVEEFRAPIVDRAILAIVNQGILLETDSHGLTAATRKLVAHRVLERLATPVPYEGKRWPLRNIIQNQARHLAVAVRGERLYRAFASRW